MLLEIFFCSVKDFIEKFDFGVTTFSEMAPLTPEDILEIEKLLAEMEEKNY